MPYCATKAFELAQLGDEVEWRRLWRSLLHFMVRQNARNYAHVYGRPLRYRELACLVKGYGRQLFGAPTRRQYLEQNRQYQAAIIEAEITKFAGFDVIQTGA